MQTIGNDLKVKTISDSIPDFSFHDTWSPHYLKLSDFFVVSPLCVLIFHVLQVACAQLKEIRNKE